MRKVILRSANHVLWAVQRFLPGNPVLDQHRQIRRINQNRSDYATQVKFPSVVRKTEAQGVLLPEHAQMAMSSILVLLLSGPHRCRITIFMQLAQSQKFYSAFKGSRFWLFFKHTEKQIVTNNIKTKTAWSCSNFQHHLNIMRIDLTLFSPKTQLLTKMWVKNPLQLFPFGCIWYYFS